MDNNRTALITGASSGIGLELARLFARDGYNLVLLARNKAKLEELAGDLQKNFDTQSTLLKIDLSDPGAPREIVDELARRSISVDILVNNAGTDVYDWFIEAGTEKLIAMIQVNITSLVHLTRLLLPGMIARGHGKIVNLASTGAYIPSPLNAVYCASKSFVLSFSQAIAVELHGTGVTVTAICPGATQTDFVQKHGMGDILAFRNAMDARRVAKIGYRGLVNNRRVVITGFGNELIALIYRIAALLFPIIPLGILKRASRLVLGKANV